MYSRQIIDVFSAWANKSFMLAFLRCCWSDIFATLHNDNIYQAVHIHTGFSDWPNSTWWYLYQALHGHAGFSDFDQTLHDGTSTKLYMVMLVSVNLTKDCMMVPLPSFTWSCWFQWLFECELTERFLFLFLFQCRVIVTENRTPARTSTNTGTVTVSVVRNTAPYFVSSPYSGSIDRNANDNDVVATYATGDDDVDVSGK